MASYVAQLPGLFATMALAAEEEDIEKYSELLDEVRNYLIDRKPTLDDFIAAEKCRSFLQSELRRLRKLEATKTATQLGQTLGGLGTGAAGAAVSGLLAGTPVGLVLLVPVLIGLGLVGWSIVANGSVAEWTALRPDMEKLLKPLDAMIFRGSRLRVTTEGFDLEEVREEIAEALGGESSKGSKKA